MSQLSYALEPAPVEALAESSTAGVPWIEPPKRSVMQSVLMAVPVLFGAGGYFLGAAILTDAAFLALTILCAIFLMADLRRFSERYGLGGVVLFGGVLTWFCYDYMGNWFLAWTGQWRGIISQEVVAKAAMYTMLYVLSMTIGIRISKGQWLSRLITRLPEPPSPSNYFIIVLLTQIVGLIPYSIFTREPFFMALIHTVTGGRSGLGTQWTVGRTGNVNFSWGAYVAQMIQIGQGGAILASFCIIFLRQNLFRNIVCGLIWLLWFLLSFGSGTRGEIVLFMLPLLSFVFIRFHIQAQEILRKYSIRAYIIAAGIVFVSLVIVKIQTTYRDTGFSSIDISSVAKTSLGGNSMFSEGLLGFSYIPEKHNFFYSSYPGEAFILPIPDFIFWAAVAPMPRAIWTSKPIDPFWKWYNAVSTGRSTLEGGATEGTTIAEGIVGFWFFRFGLAGVIEGGLFMGWLMGRFESMLYNNGGRPLAFFASLALLTWIFRAYRNADLGDLADVLVVVGGLAIAVLIARPFLGAPNSGSSA